MNVEGVLEGIAARVPKPEREYIDQDGFTRCAACHERTQVEIEFAGKKKIVPCICRCQKERDAELDRIARQADVERNRRRCFEETNMAAWNFANDDRQRPKISDAMYRYADRFPEFRKIGKGILLYGTVGTGKTYYAACIANKLLDDGYSVLMTNIATLTNKRQGMFDGKQEYINSLNRYDLLIIDDLGTERKSANGYMQEIVFNLFDSRYRSGLPFIVTTNLTPDELKKPGSVEYARIYDRVLERCFPIEISGASRRRAALKETYNDMKEMLGL